MSWFRLDDQGAFHPKVVKAGNEVYGAWCRAGQWCSAYSPSGYIPEEVAHVIAPPKVWQRALESGLLDPVDGPGYQIHDFNEYNPSEVQADERRARVSAARAEAGRRGGLSKAKRLAIASERPSKPVAIATADPLAKGLAKPWQNDGNCLANSSPDPDPDPDPREREAPALAKPEMAEPGPTQIDPDLALADEWRAYAEMQALTDIDGEWVAFVADRRSKRVLSWDWLAEWKKWVARARKFQAMERERERSRGGGGDAPADADEERQRPAYHAEWKPPKHPKLTAAEELENQRLMAEFMEKIK